MPQSSLADVIIVAAGSGSRFGGAKQFVELHGMPLYRHSLKVFAEHPLIGRIVLVISPDDVSRIEQELWPVFDDGKIFISLGGTLRQDSVANGMQKLEELGGSVIVLVHDAARPFVLKETITNVIRAIEEHGAALAAVPVVDTLKRSKDGFSVSTIPRENIWRAQTPQGASFDLLRKALKSSYENGYAVTDEADLLERIGAKPQLVRGDERNVKITYQKDLEVYKGATA